jgi:hypothetical protein
MLRVFRRLGHGRPEVRCPPPTAGGGASNPGITTGGAPGRRERRPLPWGIRTCLDLANADRRLVRGLLTAAGEAL